MPRLLSFYRYFEAPDVLRLRDRLCSAFSAYGAGGRVYVSSEGVNGQITVPGSLVPPVTRLLRRLGLGDPVIDPARVEPADAFEELHVSCKDNLVAEDTGPGQEPIDGTPPTDPSAYLDPAEWAARLMAARGSQEAPLLIDARNWYESDIGTFEGAVPMDTDEHRTAVQAVVGLLDKHRGGDRGAEVLMFCTGGIRCEKLGHILRNNHGFENVKSLKGGIVSFSAYQRQQQRQQRQPAAAPLFRGANVVFDRRGSVPVTRDNLAPCLHCGAPTSSISNCANEACNVVLLQCARCRGAFSGCCSAACAAICSELSRSELMALAPGPTAVKRRRRNHQKAWARHLCASSVSSEIDPIRGRLAQARAGGTEALIEAADALLKDQAAAFAAAAPAGSVTGEGPSCAQHYAERHSSDPAAANPLLRALHSSEAIAEAAGGRARLADNTMDHASGWVLQQLATEAALRTQLFHPGRGTVCIDCGTLGGASAAWAAGGLRAAGCSAHAAAVWTIELNEALAGAVGAVLAAERADGSDTAALVRDPIADDALSVLVAASQGAGPLGGSLAAAGGASLVLVDCAKRHTLALVDLLLDSPGLLRPDGAVVVHDSMMGWSQADQPGSSAANHKAQRSMRAATLALAARSAVWDVRVLPLAGRGDAEDGGLTVIRRRLRESDA